MSKKKNEIEETTVVDEATIESETVEAKNVERVEDRENDVETFIRNKLTALNKMDNPAKAERAARRILGNRKEK